MEAEGEAVSFVTSEEENDLHEIDKGARQDDPPPHRPRATTLATMAPAPVTCTRHVPDTSAHGMKGEFLRENLIDAISHRRETRVSVDGSNDRFQSPFQNQRWQLVSPLFFAAP